MEGSTAGAEVAERRAGAVPLASGGVQRPQRLQGVKERSSKVAADDHGRQTPRRKSLSFWLLIVFYPFTQSLSSYPVVSGRVSAELVFSLVCLLILIVEVACGRVELVTGNLFFLLGLALWLGANVGSLRLHAELGTTSLVFRMTLKAMFAYMVLCVLRANGGVDVLLKVYTAGYALAGLVGIVFVVQSGDLRILQTASLVMRDLESDAVIDFYAGIARAGVGNLLPIWICAVFYASTETRWKRNLLKAAVVYFAILAVLALRREVLIEAVLGLVVLFFGMPRRFRLMVATSGLLMGVVFLITIALSENWRDRLWLETRMQFALGEDPRTVLLLNTPTELMREPLFGHGPGSYPLRMSKYLNTPDSVLREGEGIAAHNSFSRAAVETGLIGLLSFTFMAAALGWRAVCGRNAPTARSGRRVASARVAVVHANAENSMGKELSKPLAGSPASALGRRGASRSVRGAGVPQNSRIPPIILRSGVNLRLAALMLLLHVMDWLIFGDGIAATNTWFFIGVLLYLDHRLSKEGARGTRPSWRPESAVS